VYHFQDACSPAEQFCSHPQLLPVRNAVVTVGQFSSSPATSYLTTELPGAGAVESQCQPILGSCMYAGIPGSLYFSAFQIFELLHLFPARTSGTCHSSQGDVLDLNGTSYCSCQAVKGTNQALDLSWYYAVWRQRGTAREICLNDSGIIPSPGTLFTRYVMLVSPAPRPSLGAWLGRSQPGWKPLTALHDGKRQTYRKGADLSQRVPGGCAKRPARR